MTNRWCDISRHCALYSHSNSYSVKEPEKRAVSLLLISVGNKIPYMSNRELQLHYLTTVDYSVDNCNLHDQSQ